MLEAFFKINRGETRYYGHGKKFPPGFPDFKFEEE